jgi:hypothetical protein
MMTTACIINSSVHDAIILIFTILIVLIACLFGNVAMPIISKSRRHEASRADAYRVYSPFPEPLKPCYESEEASR